MFINLLFTNGLLGISSNTSSFQNILNNKIGIILCKLGKYPKEIMKMERHFSALQRWLQKQLKIIIVSQILISLSGLIALEVQS